MSDPLKLLREYIISSKTIKEKDDYIIFGDTAFLKTAKTNYLVWNKKDDYYTLDSLYFFYKKRALQHTAYVKEAAEKKIQIVTRADRKTLEDYLLKEKLEKLPASIDLSAPIPSSIHVSKIQSDADQADLSKRPRIEYDEARKPSERVLAMLEGTSRPQANKPDAIRDLSKEHGLTKDKIAALRQKALANKRNQIKSTEEELMAAASLDDRRLDSLTALGVAVIDLTKDVTGRERLWRTRSTCLEAPSKNFAKSVLPILQTVRSRDDPLLGPQTAPLTGQNMNATSSNLGQDGPKPYHKSSGQMAGYSRYDQERFRKEETEGFQINTMGTYRGITLKSITEGAKPKPQTVPSTNNNNNASTTKKPNTGNLSGVGVTSQKAMDTTSNGKPHKRTSRTPIIVIPAASTSLITMYNAREILHDLKFISTDEKKSQGCKRENELLIQRQKENHVTAPYRIVDNPLKLTTEEWDRVVAVFVQGAAWQFKEWPYANPSDIFAKISAFHLKWDDHNLDPNVAKWNVNVIALSRTKRHLDRASLIKIWDALDRHIMKHKPFLRS